MGPDEEVLVEEEPVVEEEFEAEMAEEPIRPRRRAKRKTKPKKPEGPFRYQCLRDQLEQGMIMKAGTIIELPGPMAEQMLKPGHGGAPPHFERI